MGDILKNIGKVQIWKQIIFGILFACSLFIVASLSITKKNIVRDSVQGNVISKHCGEVYFEKKNRYKNCNMKVHFVTKDNKKIETTINTILKNSETISNNPIILYIVSNPSDAIFKKDKPIQPKYIASGASCFGILMLIFVYFNYKYRKSETWQTYSGVTGTAEIISSVTNR